MKPTALLIAWSLSAISSYAQVTFQQIYLFPFSTPGPNAPECTLVETSPGVFYGTTSTGSYPTGTLFRVTSTGDYSTLASFDSTTEGTSPQGALVQYVDGNLYGVAFGGGVNGGGTLYRTDLSGNIRVLYNFPSASTPYSLILSSKGGLYGTVSGSRSSAFVLGASGQPITLHTFSGAEGSPAGPLAEANDGNLYGLTSNGIYQLTPSGKFTMLHVLSGNDGSSPIGNLVQSANGLLYGVAFIGGTDNFGTVFAASATGGFQVIHNFTGAAPDLGFPLTGTARANDGAVYGTAGLGPGTVFRVSPKNQFTTVVEFPTSFPGGNPNFPSPALVQGSDGFLYGVQTTFGGAVYKLGVGLTGPLPSVSTIQPASGPVGAKVTLFGDNLLGATAVSFNGALAPFSVDGVQVINAVVPPDATTGLVTITTPNGSRASKGTFTVTSAE